MLDPPSNHFLQRPTLGNDLIHAGEAHDRSIVRPPLQHPLRIRNRKPLVRLPDLRTSVKDDLNMILGAQVKRRKMPGRVEAGCIPLDGFPNARLGAKNDFSQSNDLLLEGVVGGFEEDFDGMGWWHGEFKVALFLLMRSRRHFSWYGTALAECNVNSRNVTQPQRRLGEGPCFR